MSNDWIVQLAARERLERDGLNAALESLRYKFGTMFDFPPHNIVDDQKFRQENPDHPMAGPQRFIRIEAADFVNSTVDKDPSLIDEGVLEQLHEALFDRCATVRGVIAEVLGKIRRPQSIPVLERLLAVEDESKGVRDAATASIQDCHNAEGDV